MSEGETSKAHDNKVLVSPVSPTQSYHLDCTVNGEKVSFLLDMGAAVALLRKDTWDRVVPDSQRSLQTYSTVQLIGVDGSPLTVHGNTTIDLHFNGHSVTTEVVVVSSLTAEAILGLDFLQEHQVYIDLFNGQIWLADRGISLPLCAPSVLLALIDRITVLVREKVEIQPWSEVKITTSIEQPGVQGTWLLEESTRKCPAASVA